MSTFYVNITRTDTDLDSGFGPYESRVQALAAQERIDERLTKFDWFDGSRIGTVEPQDSLMSERAR